MATSESERAQGSLLHRYGWLFVFITLVLAAHLTFVTTGYATREPAGILVLVGIEIIAVRVVPWNYPIGNPLAGRPPAQLQAETRRLLTWALLYPVLLIPVVISMRLQLLPILPGWTNFYLLSWNYFAFGKILLLFMPALYFMWKYGGSGYQLGLRGIVNWWGWVVPVGLALLYITVVVFSLVAESMAPGSRQVPFGLMVLLWLIAFSAAGWTEEFFYRVLLQTRLELFLGRWNGLAVATLLFGALHVPSRFPFEWLGTTGAPLLDLALACASVLVVQTTLGLFLGYLWMRFRNAVAIVLLHTAIDALSFISLLMTGR